MNCVSAFKCLLGFPPGCLQFLAGVSYQCVFALCPIAITTPDFKIDLQAALPKLMLCWSTHSGNSGLQVAAFLEAGRSHPAPPHGFPPP